jgi:hemerythrin-like domain-containing protein
MYATQQLRDEHEGILTMLAVLERMADGAARGTVNWTHAAQVLDFLRTFADRCHHGKEEDLLFPALARMGMPTDGGPIGVMLAEHTQGRAAIRGMADAIEQQYPGDFAAFARQYIALLREHINKENNILFMLAERMLPLAVHEELTAAFTAVEHERIGDGVHEQYHQLIETLAQQYLASAA